MAFPRIAAALALILLAAPAARAASLPYACEAPPEFVEPDHPLPRFAARLARPGPVTVAFYGTSSTAGSGASAEAKAFPARFADELRARFPQVVVSVNARRGRTAEDMLADIKADALVGLPGLVVWQTGTSDAVRNLDLDSFRDALENGIGILQANGIEVVLVDQQYRPRSAAMVEVGPYRHYLEQIADKYAVNLFHRFDVMQSWIESGRLSFDNPARRAQLAAAEQVHDCIGRLLARLVVDAVDRARTQAR